MAVFSLLRTISTRVHCFAPTNFPPDPPRTAVPPVVVEARPATPLHVACEKGDISEALSQLTTESLNAQDSDGETPAMKSAKSGNIRMLELLIKAGANFEIADYHGWTVLHWTVQSGHAHLVSTLLDYAPVLLNVPDRRGLTALHVAAWTGDAVLIKRLLHEGAELNATTQWGETPLHMAAYFGHEEAVKVLLEAGADARKKDRMQRTPLSLVKGLDDQRPEKLRILAFLETAKSSS